MKVPVLWVNFDPDAIVRGYWDQGLLERIFDGKVWSTRHVYEHHEVRDEIDVPDVDGAIVILPGRFHADRMGEVNAMLNRLSWVVLLVTSDEESLFPIDQLRHPRLRLWVMTPDPARQYDSGVRFLGEYFKADTPDILWQFDADMADRRVDVAFMGQVTHPRRERVYDALKAIQHAHELVVGLEATSSFAAGFDRTDYLQRMAQTKVAPCPAGPATADSFRFFEALEAGCLPVADARSEGKPEGYWWRLFFDMFQDPMPFPVLDDWSRLPELVEGAVAQWPLHANRAQAWWQRYKRNLVRLLEDDVDAITDTAPDLSNLSSLVTAIVPTSPIPSHPSTAILDETLDSIQARWPGCEIVVVFDGVRDEQRDRVAAYEEYKRRALRSFNFERPDVVPVVLEEHRHQANATRAALDLVRTPLVLFVEHDTPLIGDLPVNDLAALVLAGEANVVRFHHEANVLEPHRHLMLDEEPRDVMGVPLLGTVQWSQRPHLASTAFYRSMIRRYFGRESRTMIEDVMHGVVQSAAREGAWGMFRLFMYAPPGDMKRSTHSDGRGGDPKFDDRFVIEYDGDTPEWAPRPTSEIAAAEADAGRQPGTEDPT